MLGMEIGRRLKAYRDSHDLSHQQAAKRASVSASLWTNYERGYGFAPDGRKIDTNYTEKSVSKIARALGWPVNDALTWAGLESTTGDEPEPVALPPSAQDPRDEITEILSQLSESRARALLYVARSMLDAEALVPANLEGDRLLVREVDPIQEQSHEEREATRPTSGIPPQNGPRTT